MLIHSIKALSITAALALVGTAAWAQNNPAPQQPVTRIGVTPQDAKEAVQKAPPAADTGTLVRTEPSAADRAGDMVDGAKSSVKPEKPTAHKTTPAKTTHPKTTNKHRANTAPTPGSASNNQTTGTVNNTTTPSAAMGITGTVPGNPPTTGDGSQSMDDPDKSSSGTPTKP